MASMQMVARCVIHYQSLVVHYSITRLTRNKTFFSFFFRCAIFTNPFSSFRTAKQFPVLRLSNRASPKKISSRNFFSNGSHKIKKQKNQILKQTKSNMSNEDNKNNQEDVELELNDEQREKKAIDQQEKLKLLIKHLQGYCNAESEHDDLRNIGNALQNGATLTGTVISGGYTNYSYKIHLDNVDDNEGAYDKDLAVFAKIAFPFALWDPSRESHYDLSRVTAEFELMTRLSKELKITTESGRSKSPVPRPYELIDISAAEDGTYPEMKIFVAEWVAPTDEQWGNQFIEGEIDNRVIDQCAKTLAMINLTDIDDGFNQGFIKCFTEISAGLGSLMREVVERESDKAVIYARDVLGTEKLDDIVKNWTASGQEKECLVHGDAVSVLSRTIGRS